MRGGHPKAAATTAGFGSITCDLRRYRRRCRLRAQARHRRRHQPGSCAALLGRRSGCSVPACSDPEGCGGACAARRGRETMAWGDGTSGRNGDAALQRYRGLDSTARAPWRRVRRPTRRAPQDRPPCALSAWRARGPHGGRCVLRGVRARGRCGACRGGGAAGSSREPVAAGRHGAGEDGRAYRRATRRERRLHRARRALCRAYLFGSARRAGGRQRSNAEGPGRPAGRRRELARPRRVSVEGSFPSGGAVSGPRRAVG